MIHKNHIRAEVKTSCFRPIHVRAEIGGGFFFGMMFTIGAVCGLVCILIVVALLAEAGCVTPPPALGG